jgi:hypothetical protein
MSPTKALTCHLLTDGPTNKPLTNDQETGFHTRNLASDLLFRVGVAGFEPTASSSRTRGIGVRRTSMCWSCVVVTFVTVCCIILSCWAPLLCSGLVAQDGEDALGTSS